MSAPATIVTSGSPSRCGYGPSADCAIIFAESGGFILDMNSSLFALDQNSAEMLRTALQAGLDEAALQAAQRSGCSPADERSNIADFLASLRAQGLLETEPLTRRPGRGARLLARIAVAIARRRPGLGRTRCMLAAARLSLQRWGWPSTFRAWREALGRGPRTTGPGDIAEIDHLLANAASLDLTGSACQERALCAWLLARIAGHEARAVIGFRPYPPAGHCWCAVDERPVGDRPERIAAFTPLLTYA